MKNVVEYLEKTALSKPLNIAVINKNESITYYEYKVRSQQCASFIFNHCRPRTPIIVYMEKGIEALTVFMGVAYARCFYIFIDPSQHPSRIQEILDITESKYVVVNGQEFPSSINYDGDFVSYETLMNERIDRKGIMNVASTRLDTDPLYCNFTSGTTGLPKGVLVSHRSVIDFIDHFTSVFDINEDDKIGNQAPFDFDVSVKDIYSCLSTGASLVVIPKPYFSVITTLIDYIIEKEVTILVWAVSAISMIAQFKGLEYKIPHKIRMIMFSGEKMPIPILIKWKNKLPKSQFINLYGPTEITCNCTYEWIPEVINDQYVMPIGKAFANECVVLLDENNQEITDSNKNGEICVVGSCLALGYYNNNEQTKCVFVQNPLNTKYPENMYRTGDLAYFGTDGKLYYIGRKDFQIKHMGHRIELEGIETIAYQNDGVTQVCCFYNETNQKIILLYTGKVESIELKRYFIESVPYYMVPSIIVSYDTLPLNKNGKLDRTKIRKEYEIKYG
ncbi:AMP-binding protein [Erysipelothrix aquatica]|uniref:AMP-binding protein n=1 Tax=Erysipelothrix aquatica TaxID=2683714 RepID=UPI00135A8FF6|nr:AMP-binding protein [Erysipelothrix aquatica]